MKKIFTLMAAAVMALSANAKDYTDDLAITLNGMPTAPAQAKITVNPVAGSDGLYDIVLNQFTFGGVFLIGDVTIEDVVGNSTDGMDGYTYFEPITKEATITNAEGSSIAQLLGYKVTVTINEGSKMSDNDLYLLIELPVDYGTSHFDVAAVFGTGGYQIKNSGFEYFHKATYTSGSKEYSSDEPNGWHSFMSSTGLRAGVVSTTTKTFISPNTLEVFKIPRDDPEYYGNMKLYDAQIYEDDVLIQDLICVDDNGSPAVFDMLNRKYYYNLGTSGFIEGPVITRTYSSLKPATLKTVSDILLYSEKEEYKNYQVNSKNLDYILDLVPIKRISDGKMA